MDFRENGRLLYEFSVGDRRRIVPLFYRVQGELLYTDNPAALQVRSTRFHLAAGDILEFDFVGARAWFVRELHESALPAMR